MSSKKAQCRGSPQNVRDPNTQTANYEKSSLVKFCATLQRLPRRSSAIARKVSAASPENAAKKLLSYATFVLFIIKCKYFIVTIILLLNLLLIAIKLHFRVQNVVFSSQNVFLFKIFISACFLVEKNGDKEFSIFQTAPSDTDHSGCGPKLRTSCSSNFFFRNHNATSVVFKES